MVVVTSEPSRFAGVDRRDAGAGKPVVCSRRTRMADLAIAATANVHGATLLTHDADDLQIIADLIDLRPA